MSAPFLVFQNVPYMLAWAGDKIAGQPDFFKPETATAIGVGIDERLIAVVVYSNYRETGVKSCEMSIASIDKKWANRHTLSALFSYPFAQLNLGRVSAHCSKHDEGVRQFLIRLGFVQEGVHRCAHHSGSDALSFGMLRSDCKWIGKHG